MPHIFSDVPNKLGVLLSEAANIFLVIVMIYIFQYIFNSQFSCSCTKEFHVIVLVYIVLIPIILFFLLKLIKQTRTKVCGAVCHGFFSQFLQFFVIFLFWGGFICLDGDLYLCSITKHNDSQRELPCKKDLTLQEMSIITIHKNHSQLYGYIIIAGGFFGWWLISNTKVWIFCQRLKDCCCNLTSCQRLKDCCCNLTTCQRLKDCCYKIWNGKPYYKLRYEELLSVETDRHLDEKLQEIAKKRAESICSEHLVDIENSEFSKIRTTQMSDKAKNAWSEISRPYFYASDLSEDVNGESLEVIYRIL